MVVFPYDWGLIKENPLKNLKLSKIDHSPKVRYLSLDEEKRLRQTLYKREIRLKQKRRNASVWRKERGYTLFPEYSGDEYCDHLMLMVLLSINTGLRQGKLFHLTWNMINTSENFIIVAGDITKNSSSRYIPLNDEAGRIIQALYLSSVSKKGLVFSSKNNQPFKNVKRSWAVILKKAKILSFRWHNLRHHFASKLVMAGVDLNTVHELLGHSEIKLTLRYAHLAPEYKIHAVKKINWINQPKI
ncbi:tyrosine-type recombinase/integrase [Legionella gresilensis]|uniref:tyrosine-type recombinase/integrase n=1 Tax=Legionella gresilensis TaxID=91823 RepID=UPI001040F32A|nr:site-specific integrase [Legionella gresilensis]